MEQARRPHVNCTAYLLRGMRLRMSQGSLLGEPNACHWLISCRRSARRARLRSRHGSRARKRIKLVALEATCVFRRQGRCALTPRPWIDAAEYGPNREETESAYAFSVVSSQPGISYLVLS